MSPPSVSSSFTSSHSPGGIAAAFTTRWAKALLLATLLGAVLRFGELGEKTIWLDEAFSLWMARHDLPSLFDWLIRIDHHPPLYYILLHGWTSWFGDSPNALRSLSALASTLAIPFYALAARRFAGEQVGIVVALLLALAPFHVRYAQEARMYAVLTLAVAILLYALARLLTGRTTDTARSRLGSWGLLAIAEAAAMLTHNTATVLLPLALNFAIGGLWLAKRRGGQTNGLDGLEAPGFFRHWWLSQVAVILLWSPWAWPFMRQAQVVDADFWISPPNFSAVWMALNSLTFGTLPNWLPLRDLWVLLGVALACRGIWQWRHRPGLVWLLLSLWLQPPLVELLVSLRRPIFYDRTLIWATLPYDLLIARGLVSPTGFRNQRQAIPLALFMMLCGLGLWSYYVSFEKEEWDQAAHHVASHAQPHDLILFHASWIELPFNYHYPSGAPTLIHHGIPADLFDAGALEPPMTPADVPRVRQLVAEHVDDQSHLWLIYSHWWYTDPQELLLQVLGEELRLVDRVEWTGIKIMQYEKR